MSELFQSWSLLLELLGNPNNWDPMKLLYRDSFWNPLTYKSRLLVASFCYQNGVEERILLKFLTALKREKRDLDKIRGLYKYWNDPESGFDRRLRYFAFDIINGIFKNLDGKVWCNDQMRYRRVIQNNHTYIRRIQFPRTFFLLLI